MRGGLDCTRIRRGVGSGLVLAGAAAAQPNLPTARLASRAGADLAGAFTSLSGEAGPLWIGYAVPAQNPDWNACCHSDRDGGRCCGRCLLEEGRSADRTRGTGATGAPVQLEGSSQVVVLYRVENREVERIRAYSDACEIDAGGRTVYWLTGVSTTASIDLLLQWASRPVPEGERRDRIADGAMHALSAHKDPAADRALAGLLASDRPMATRRQAAFWAATARGRSGFELVRAALLDASNPEPLRKHLTFAVSQSHEPEAVTTLTRTAKGDGSPAVRGEAIFWLAQKAGRAAAAAITDVIANDPETKVKERAVFALSQLPKDDGVPRLIDVARSNRNPAVRKQAIFWLGESRDPRALAFFEEILARP